MAYKDLSKKINIYNFKPGMTITVPIFNKEKYIGTLRGIILNVSSYKNCCTIISDSFSAKFKYFFGRTTLKDQKKFLKEYIQINNCNSYFRVDVDEEVPQIIGTKPNFEVIITLINGQQLSDKNLNYIKMLERVSYITDWHYPKFGDVPDGSYVIWISKSNDNQVGNVHIGYRHKDLKLWRAMEFDDLALHESDYTIEKWAYY